MIKRILNNPYFNALRGINGVLDLDQKKRSIPMVFLLIVNAIMDLIGLATIGVLIQISLEGNAISAPNFERVDANSNLEFYFINFLRLFYDNLDLNNEMQFLFIISAFIFIIFIVKNLLSLGILYLQARYSFNVALRLSKKMFQHYYNKGYIFISDRNTGDKVYQLNQIPYVFAIGYLFPIFNFTTDLVLVLFISLVLIAINPMAVFLLLLVVVPTFFGVYYLSKNRVESIGNERNRLHPLALNTINEGMKAYINVKLGNKENFVFEKFSEIQNKLNQIDAKLAGIYYKVHQKINDIVFGLGIMIIFGFSWYSNDSKEDVLKILGFFGIAAYKLLPAINNMLGSILGIKSYAYVLDELKPIVGTELKKFPEINPIKFNQNIEFRNLGFNYPESDKRIFNNFSIQIKKGETIGLVGKSGSGKTTFLKVFLRLIRETKGKFLVDGIEIKSEMENAMFQKIIGYVEQDTFIFNGTLEDNIALLEKDIDYERLAMSIKDAQLFEFVSQHPDGLKMKLGENGIKMSGGQKQRVGIARALYKNPEILVLDEITSALDSVTEKEIVKVINDLSGLGKTIIIVAHRKSTLEKANRIIELDNL